MERRRLVFPVEISIRDEQELTPRMSAMRQWLDHCGFEPSVFRYTFGVPGLVIHVEFKVEAEAIAFAKEFEGQVIQVSAEMRVAGPANFRHLMEGKSPQKSL